MTQLDMVLDNPTRIPDPESQCYALLLAFQRGEHLTTLEAALKYGVMALSQRCGDLRRKYGWPVKSRTVETQGGAKVSEYFL